MTQFDVQGAFNAGYSPAEVADYLAQQHKFDAAGARAVGYTDQDIISHLTTANKPNDSKARSATLGAIQGVTAGFGDEVHGADQAVLQLVANKLGTPIPDAADAIAKGIVKIGDVLTGSDNAELSGPIHWAKPGEKTMQQAYVDARDQARAQNSQAQKSNPFTYGASEAVGSIAPAIAMPATRVGGPVLNTALNGAIQGGLFGLGNSNADNVRDAAIDTATGAGIGGAIGGTVAGVVSPGAKAVTGWVADKLRNGADNMAFRAVGGQKYLAKQLANKGLTPEQVGRFALDQDVVKPLRTTSKMADVVDDIKTAAGNDVDSVYANVDAAGASRVTPQDVVKRLEALKKPNTTPGTVQQLHNDAIESAQQMVGAQLTDANGFLSASTLRALRQQIDENINFAKAPGSSAYGKKEALHAARNEVRDAIKSSISDPADVATFNGANHKFRMASELEDALANKAAQAGNNTIGLKDAVIAAGGAAHSGPVGALASVIGGKLVSSQGNAVGAVTADAVSKALRKLDKANLDPEMKLYIARALAAQQDEQQSQ